MTRIVRPMNLRIISPGLSKELHVRAERTDTVLELKQRVHALLDKDERRTPAPKLRLRVAQSSAGAPYVRTQHTSLEPAAVPTDGRDDPAPVLRRGLLEAGRWLDERRTLGASGVCRDSVLELCIPAFVKIRPIGHCEEVELWVDRFAPLAELRADFEREMTRRVPAGDESSKVRADAQLLAAPSGRLLADHRTLADYWLEHGALLSAVVRAPAGSAFCVARAALSEMLHAASAGVEDVVVRSTQPLQPRATAQAQAQAEAQFGAKAAQEQARAFGEAHAALGEALRGLVALQRTDESLRAELRQLADEDAAAAQQLALAAKRASALLVATRAGLCALEGLAESS